MPDGMLRYFDDRRTKAVVECETGFFSGPFPLSKLPPELAAQLQASPLGIAVAVDDTERPYQHIRVTNRPADPDRPLPFSTISRVDASVDPARIFVTDRQSILDDKFQVTDKSLGLRQGHSFRKNRRFEHSGNIIASLGGTLPSSLDPKPDINRNPYNFVALAGDKPWLEEPDPAIGKHQGHDRWRCELLHGYIDIALQAVTPVFVPAGFPFKPKEPDTDERYFCKLRRACNAEKQYAIPGSSMKGPLRAMVEAVANDRFGSANREFYKMPIPYRRRSFQAGLLGSENPNGRTVEQVGVLFVRPSDWPRGVPNDYRQLQYRYRRERRGTFAVPGRQRVSRRECFQEFRGSLLAWDKAEHGYSHVILEPTGRTFHLAPTVVETYRANLRHEHYERHFEEDGSKYPTLPQDSALFRGRLEDLGEGRLVWFTHQDGEVTSFGKNMNYLWPAEHSVFELAQRYFPPESLGLQHPLGLAERMFGFAAEHDRGDGMRRPSHPFRGRLRFETFWADGGETERLELAPLTAPRTRAKSRPLYLVGRSDLAQDPKKPLSASYSDQHPLLRGRKFYWRQNFGHETIWEGHIPKKALANATQTEEPQSHAQIPHEAKQCPPPINALKTGTSFQGRIHFENLSHVELGALLFALTGRSSTDPAENGGARKGHTVQLGKGKPRGLGTLKPASIQVSFRHPQVEYQSLLNGSKAPSATDQELAPYRQAFENWCAARAGKPFAELGHIQDFLNLHTWPGAVSVRYYPLHWSDYGWLPEANQSPDEPKGGVQRRPPAMKLARDLSP